MLITGHAHGVVVLVDKLVIPFSSLSIQRIPLEAHHFGHFFFREESGASFRVVLASLSGSRQKRNGQLLTKQEKTDVGVK